MPASSTLNVDFLANAAGNSSPTTNPPAQGDSSAHLATTGWTQTEMASAINTAFTPLLAARDGGITNLFRVTAPGASYTKGQRIRVRFDHPAFPSQSPLPYGKHSSFFASLLTPDAVINTNTWLTDANLVATSTRTTGARNNARARVYQANGTPSNSRVYSKYQDASFAANTTYQATITLMYVAGGTFPTAGFALRVPYRDASNNPQYAVASILNVPNNSTYVEVSVTFTTGYASTGTYELLYGLNTPCSFAVSDFRVVKVEGSPRLNINNLPLSPLMVQYHEASGIKCNFQPAANSSAELEFDGVDWVVMSSQSTVGHPGRFINGTTLDQAQLQGHDLGSTVVYSGGQAVTVYAVKQADLDTGGSITLVNNSAFPMTVLNGQGSTSSGDHFVQNGESSTLRYLTVAPYSSATLTYVDSTFGIFAEGDLGIQTRNLRNWASFQSPDGYQKLPNGLILQWGGVTFAGSYGASGQVCSFNIAFPTQCLQIIASDVGAGAHGTGAQIVSASQFRVWGRTPTDGAYLDTGIHWMAIGY